MYGGLMTHIIGNVYSSTVVVPPHRQRPVCPPLPSFRLAPFPSSPPPFQQTAAAANTAANITKYSAMVMQQPILPLRQHYVYIYVCTALMYVRIHEILTTKLNSTRRVRNISKVHHRFTLLFAYRLRLICIRPVCDKSSYMRE